MKNAGKIGKNVNIFAKATNNQNSNNNSSSMLASIAQSGPSNYNPAAAAVVGELIQSLVTQKANIVNELPTDESVAYDDPDINQRYIELQKLLLNPLRTEIISIAEYIPLSSGDSLLEGSASINLNLGAQSKITVTNVARLIELHRQVREYVTNSASVLFQTLYPVKSSEDFLQYLKKAVNENIESASQFSALDSVNNTNRIKKTIDSIIQIIKSGYTGGFELSPAYIAMIKEKDNDAFTRGLIEYFIYEIIILDIIRFIGGISTIREKLIDNWQIDKCLQLNPFNPSTSIRNQNISSAFQNSNLALNEPSNIDKKVIGFKRKALDSDYDMIINLFSNISSLVMHKDSVTFLESYRNSNKSIDRNPGEIIAGLSGDLGNLLSKIKLINQASMLQGVPSHVRLGASISQNFSNNTALFNFYKSDIYDVNGDAPSGNQIISEVLSAMLFDMASFHVNYTLSHKENKNSLKNKLKFIPAGDNSLYDGIKALEEQLNLQLLENFKKVKYENKGIPVSAGAPYRYPGIGRLLSGYGRAKLSTQSPSDGDISANVLPMESTNNESIVFSSGNNSEGYMTGPEYFFESKISKNITDNSEMIQFAQDYKDSINSFIEDFLTFFPDYDVAKNTKKGEIGDIVGGDHSTLNVAIKLLENFVKDIDTIKSSVNSSTNSCLPIIASWLSKPYDKSQVDVMQGVYWSYVAFSRMRRIETKSKRYGEIEIDATNKIIGQLIEAFNEKVSKEFLESLFGAMDSGSKGWLTGDKSYPYWMGKSGDPYDGNELGIKAYTNKHVNNSSGKDKPYGDNVASWTTTRDKIDNDFTACFSGKGTKLEDNNALASGRPISFNDTPGFGKLVKNSLRYIAELGYTCEDNLTNEKTADVVGSNIYNQILNKDDHIRMQRGFYFYDSEKNIKNTISDAASAAASYVSNPSSAVQSAIDAAKDALSNPVDTVVNIIDNIADAIKDGNFPYSLNDYPINFPGSHGFSAHQRVIAWFWWVNSLFASCLTIKVSSAAGNKNNGKNDTFTISIDIDQLSGIKKGIEDAISVIKGSGSNISSGNTSNTFKEAYDESKKRSLTLLTTIKKRSDYIKECLGLLAAHADAISKSSNEIKYVIQGNDNNSTQSNKRKLAISVVSSQGVNPRDILPLITNYSPASMHEGYNKYFRRLDNTMFPTDINYSLVKNKFVYKILSEPGYGFLSNEKRGNKSVINVGIPLSMISSLQKRAVKETKNPNFKYSPYVSISIYKKDHLNDEIVLLPKSYVFDTSATIQDYKIVNNQRKLTNHLLNFDGDKSFDNILKSIEVTRISTNYIDNTTKIKNSIGYPAGIFDKDVMINHVVDYCLKEYSMLTTGLDYSQHSFLLKSDAINLNKVVPSPGVGADLVTEFETIITKINQIYPETLNDPQLASEVFRLVRILKNSIPFNIKNRLNKVLYPAAFDRIYSIFVNEKDFVLANDLNSIYTNGLFENNAQPVFKATSKLSRPDITTSSLVNNPYAGGVYDRSILKYAKSCKENYPEVYNYYAIVSLLPLNFVEGAEDKFMSDESIISLASATPVVAAQAGIPSGLGFKP